MESVVKVGTNPETGEAVEIKMKASALVPKLYRFKFGRDMISDMTSLRKAYNKVEKLPADATEEEREEAQLSVMDLMLFENCAYIMAKHADKTIPDNPDDWLDSLPIFSIYESMPEILKLWQMNNHTTAIPKKK